MKFNYLSLEKSTGYSYFVIPKQLVKDPKFKKISTDAKLLYSLLMDRASLSITNGWIDDNNHVYIYYTNNEIIEDLGCSKNTVTKLMQELVSIGLVEKIKQGLNRPDKIYVKNFMEEVIDEEVEKPIKSMVSPESQNLGVRNPKIWESGIPIFVNQESQNLGTNKTDINNTKKNNTEGINIKSLSSKATTNLTDSDSSENESATAAYERLISNFFPNDVNSSFGKYFIDMWYRRGYSLELIEEAIKDNLFRGNNLQIKHVDDTLTAWYESGITTALEAKKQIKQNREANRAKKTKLNHTNLDDVAVEDTNSIEIDGYTLPALVNSKLTDPYEFNRFIDGLLVPEVVLKKFEIYQLFTMLDESFDRNDCFDLFNFFVFQCPYDFIDASQHELISSIVQEITVKYTLRKNDIKTSKRSYIKSMIENVNWIQEKENYDAI